MLDPNVIFRDFVVEGTPGSGFNQPDLSLIRQFLSEVRALLLDGSVRRFATRAALIAGSAALVPVGAHVAVNHYSVAGDGGGGSYKRLAAAPASVKPEHVQSADGAWFELDVKAPLIEQFGAGHGDPDQDTAAILAARDYVYARNSATEGVRGSISCNEGRSLFVNGNLTFDYPIRIYFPAPVIEQRTNAGGPVTLGLGWSELVSGLNGEALVYIQGLVAPNQNGAPPTSISAGGGIGVMVRNMQFSSVEIGTTRGFGYIGVFFNASGDALVKQHIQQNQFRFGMIAACGIGMMIRSSSAENAAFQANVVGAWFQANVVHLDMGEVDALPANSNNNKFTVGFEPHYNNPAVVGVSIQGSYNEFELLQGETVIVLQAGSYSNKIRSYNNKSTGIVFFNNSGNTTNRVYFGPPAADVLPASPTANDNIFYRNNTGVPVKVTVRVPYTAPTGVAVLVKLIVHRMDGSDWEESVFALTPGAAQTGIATLTAEVQPDEDWKITKAGTGGTATVSWSVALAEAA